MTDELDRIKAALADKYAIERELGRGGMATVYLAEDLKHKRKVAVKVLRPELAVALGPERFLVSCAPSVAKLRCGRFRRMLTVADSHEPDTRPRTHEDPTRVVLNLHPLPRCCPRRSAE